MTTATIDSLIQIYQTRLADEKAEAKAKRRADEQEAVTLTLTAFAEFFGALWPCVQFIKPSVSFDRGRPYVALCVVVDGLPCSLISDMNKRKSVQLPGNGKTFYAERQWSESEWGEFFLAIRNAKTAEHVRQIQRLANSIFGADEVELDALLEHATSTFPDEFPTDWQIAHNWQELAGYRRRELQQRADERAREVAEREAQDRDYEARRQAALAEVTKFQPFIAYRLYYAVEQPGAEDEPFTTETVFALHEKPDADGYYATIWCGEITKSKFTFVARTDRLEILAPDDKHARICQCDYECGVYIRRTPGDAELLTVKSA